jgi:hypothetical protein
LEQSVFSLGEQCIRSNDSIEQDKMNQLNQNSRSLDVLVPTENATKATKKQRKKSKSKQGKVCGKNSRNTTDKNF